MGDIIDIGEYQQDPRSKNHAPPPPPVAVQFSFWPAETRAIPNPWGRAALFTATDPRQRKHYQDFTELAAQDDISLRYAGPQLTQADQDVWMEAVQQIQRGGHDSVYLSGASFLRALGKTKTGPNLHWLEKAAQRLTLAAVEIRHGKSWFNGHLVDAFYWHHDKQMFYIRITSEIATYLSHGYTQVDWQQRGRLRSSLAQWLHTYYSSHTRPHAVKVMTLHRLSGSQGKVLKSFRQKLKLALDGLVDVGFLKSWTLEKDLVSVVKVSPK